MQVLNKYLPKGYIYLTCDIRKCFTYDTNEIIEKQRNFFVKNKRYVKNLHISGLGTSHGALTGSEQKLKFFTDLFKNENLSLIIEILPLKVALLAKKILIKFNK